MKAYGGVEVQLKALLTSALEGGDWSATRPSRIINCVHCVTAWLRPIAGLAALWKDLTFPRTNPGSSVAQPTVQSAPPFRYLQATKD